MVVVVVVVWGGGGCRVDFVMNFLGAFLCCTEQKLAPQRRLHIQKKKKKKERREGDSEGRKGRRKQGGGRIGSVGEKVMEENGKWRQTERGVGDQTEWQGSIK